MVVRVTYMLAEKSGAVIPADELTEDHHVAVYDFGRPTTLSPEHEHAVEQAFETFARQWGVQLTARTRVMAHAEASDLALRTYEAYEALLPEATVLVTLRVAGSGAPGVLQFPAAGALNWVSHILGSQRSVTVEERKFTRIEHAIIHHFITETVEDLHVAFTGMLTEEVTVEGIHHHTGQSGPAVPMPTLMICSQLAVRVGEATVEASLALPAAPILEELGEGSATEAGRFDQRTLHQHLTQVPVDLALSTAATSVTPEAVLALSEGDILPLDHLADHSLLLTADGQRVGTAAAGTRSGRIVAVVNTTESS